jgi:hypothetical protein
MGRSRFTRRPWSWELSRLGSLSASPFRTGPLVGRSAGFTGARLSRFTGTYVGRASARRTISSVGCSLMGGASCAGAFVGSAGCTGPSLGRTSSTSPVRTTRAWSAACAGGSIVESTRRAVVGCSTRASCPGAAGQFRLGRPACVGGRAAHGGSFVERVRRTRLGYTED